MHQKKIIITDTHFGKKNNSMQFFKSQETVLKELVNYIYKLPKGDEFDIVHLGDVFDSRSTLSVNILHESTHILQQLYMAMKSVNSDNRLIFVAGNHDFYSPTSDDVCSLTVFVNKILPGAVIVDKTVWKDGKDLYVPWYVWNEHLDDIDFSGVHRVFTHTDLYQFKDDPRIPKNILIYSGHIHQLKEYCGSRLVNLSPPYSLDFGDANDDKKGWWEIGEQDQLTLHQNRTSIKFRRLTNEEIFDIPDYEESIERGDNYNILIDSENQIKKEYIDRINEMRESFRYINILPVVAASSTDDCSVSIKDINVNDILRNRIPNELKLRFDTLVSELSNQEMKE